jgi:hypothetical protein
VSEPRVPPDDRAPAPSEALPAVAEYVERNIDRYTRDALLAAALAAGYTEADVKRAIDSTAARRRPEPDVRRVRSIVIGAYLVTYLILAAGLLTSPTTTIGSFGGLAVVILTILLGLALLMSLGWLAMDWVSSFVGLISVPLVLLVLVGGACVATTGAPFGLLPR